MEQVSTTVELFNIKFHNMCMLKSKQHALSDDVPRSSGRGHLCVHTEKFIHRLSETKDRLHVCSAESFVFVLTAETLRAEAL